MMTLGWCLFVGLVAFGAGFLRGARYYAKRVVKTPEVIRGVVDEVIEGKPPPGAFIEVNKVYDYLKETKETIRLGDILEE